MSNKKASPMKLSHLALVIVLAAATAFGVVKVAAPTADTTSVAQTKETAYQRVMRTGTLRCAYYLYPQFFDQDLTTKKFSGFYYDLLEEMGRRLSLKIEWAEEVGLSNALEGLKTNRYDSVCVPLFQLPGRARVSEFTLPFVYLPFSVYVRADDTRFDNNLAKINDPAIRTAVVEGDMGQTVKNEDFPKGAFLTLPNLTDVSQLPMSVVMGKADVYMAPPSTAKAYMDKNPDKIKRADAPPVRLQGAGLAVGVGEAELKALLNTTIESLHSTGFTERLFIKSEKDKDFYYLPAQPWRRVGS